MNESQWLSHNDPTPLLEFLRDGGQLSERKARLFGAACCRRIWRLLPDEQSRTAVGLAERFADGAATAEDLREALGFAWRAYHAFVAAWIVPVRREPRGPLAPPNVAAFWASEAAGWVTQPQDPRVPPDSKLSRIDLICPIAVEAARLVRGAVGYEEPGADASERAAQAAVARDLFGTLPFRPVAVERSWLAWNSGTVVRLARAAYDNRMLPSGHLDPARLAVLADALEDAGCTDAELLAHLRGPGPHVRGCHAIDALLGRE
jgi:hypothetical protein